MTMSQNLNNLTMENENKNEVSSSVAQEVTMQASPSLPSLTSPMTIGDWMLTILISSIPLVGLVMLFVWAFGDSTNINKANWAKASLIWALIGIALAALFFGFFIGAVRNFSPR